MVPLIGFIPFLKRSNLPRFKISIRPRQDAIFAETYLDQKWWQGSQFGKSLIWPVNISLWCHGWSTVVDKTKQSIYRKTKERLTERKMTLVGSQSLKTLLSKENGWVVTQNPNNQPGRYKFVYCIELSLLLVPVLLFLPPLISYFLLLPCWTVSEDFFTGCILSHSKLLTFNADGKATFWLLAIQQSCWNSRMQNLKQFLMCFRHFSPHPKQAGVY